MEIVELFSGIGAQAKALERTNINHNILATCDWDINAIIAYDIIHHGPQIENAYQNLENVELNNLMMNLSISSNGKKPMSRRAKLGMPRAVKERLLYAIDRCHNLIDITNVTGRDLPENIDLMTYSFPCQDLSLAGNWHNNQGGIDRESGSRSALLWEVERILYERQENQLTMPRFLLMENVTAILNTRHIDNFREWQANLRMLGYYNRVYNLDARNFGVPQMRNRVYMISVYLGDLNEELQNELIELLEEINDEELSNRYQRVQFTIQDTIRDDYTNHDYYIEALLSNPNITPSRQEIFENNIIIDENTLSVPTITTKQDRHPNSGLIMFEPPTPNKMNFRYLTPRECFMIMGFDEADFQLLMDNNFATNRNHNFFSRDKLNKMAGNSICVNVLESIFEFINDMNQMILEFDDINEEVRL